ncbi:hypothetical protein [Cellulomonas sp. HZM]|uniref:hypothetical protein n=1 Tax=Cellulomonas sp. HZM TaxID=1454010 RepID=UPI00068CEDA4|nr:hypothetical protein [Cellulomonas sp. HZM]
MTRSEWDPTRGRQGRAWRALVKQLCPPGSLCERPVCLYPELDRVIVFGLRRNHPHGPSLDHIVRLADGGHPTARWNLRPAHFGCNAGWRRDAPPTERPRSRDWPPLDLS